MKSLNDYRKELITKSYTIHQFSLEGLNPTFALVKVNPNQSFFHRVLGLDITETIISSKHFSEVAHRADQILGGV